MNEKVSVCLADDHKLFREGLKSTLHSASHFSVVKEVGDAVSLKSALQKEQVDLVLLDYKMPGGGSLATLEYIKKRFKETKVVVLTGMNVGHIFQQFIDLKADGVLIKDISSEILLTALNQIMNGETFVMPEVQAVLNSNKPQLSAREYQVMELILAGLGNTEISERLCISIKTVGNHRHSLMQKFELKNSVELTRYAIKNGFIDE